MQELVSPNPKPAESPEGPTAPRSANTEKKHQLHIFIAVCSVGIIGCFFLPWITFLFGTPSGYDLQQLPSDKAKLVWFIPGTALLPILAVLAKQGVGPMAAIAGVAPFGALAYYISQYGTDLLHSLQIGSYLTFLLGALLCICSAVLGRAEK